MKDYSNVKGTLKGWTEQSTGWYESASEYTGYHDRLLQSLLRFLRSEDCCCEIACGTGILARKTAPYVSAYTANDVDPQAVTFLKKRLMAQGLSNIEVLEGKWQEILADREYDVVLTSYYGVSVADWPLITAMARRSFIVICPRNERWSSLRHRNEDPGSVQMQSVTKLDTPEPVRSFMNSHGIPFEALPLDLEFGQPFRSREEAREYVEYYYRLEGTEADQFIDEKTILKDGILYFPKKKEIEIIAADLSGLRNQK